MKFFFKRLEAYIEVRPTATMTDIVARVAVEVLLILRFVTKEITSRQKRMSKSFPIDISTIIVLMQRSFPKKLGGRRNVEGALQRLTN